MLLENGFWAQEASAALGMMTVGLAREAVVGAFPVRIAGGGLIAT
jgi:hypothetical protein